jgi:hypothetical protein
MADRVRKAERMRLADGRTGLEVALELRMRHDGEDY